MNEYLIDLVDFDTDEHTNFLCRADNRRIAEALAWETHPNLDVVRVCRVIDLDE